MEIRTLHSQDKDPTQAADYLMAQKAGELATMALTEFSVLEGSVNNTSRNNVQLKFPQNFDV